MIKYMTKEEIPVYCAWCKKHSTEWNPPAVSPKGNYGVASHGMCPECLADYRQKFREKQLAKGIKESKEFMSFEEFLIEELIKKNRK